MKENEFFDIIYEQVEKRKIELENDKEGLENKILNYNSWAWRFVIIGAVIGFLGILIYLIPDFIEKIKINELGDFLAGGVAPIWALAGLFFIYTAFLSQKQQLINQQIELLYNQAEVRATREELRGQKEQMIRQNQLLQQQQFETTFFNLLNLLNEITANIYFKSPKIRTRGRESFKELFLAFKESYKEKKEREKMLLNRDFPVRAFGAFKQDF